MSKYTEAMSSIIYTMHFRVKPKYLGHVEDENMDLMYELAEKATPKKPTEADISEEKSYCCWMCPTCGRVHINDSPLNYCCYCGQAIDWSDYEKYLDDSEDDEEAEEDES